MLVLARAWAVQVVLCVLSLILQSCVTSCPHVGANAVGRVASHLAGRGHMRLQGPYFKSEAWGDAEVVPRRAWYGLETEGQAVARPKWIPSVLREGALQKRLGPCCKPQRGAKDTSSGIPCFSSTDANGGMLAGQPTLPPGQPPGLLSLRRCSVGEKPRF